MLFVTHFAAVIALGYYYHRRLAAGDADGLLRDRKVSAG